MQETMSKEHAMRFPLVGSAMLLSLFLLFKFVSKDLVNAVLTCYFFVLGILALSYVLSSLHIGHSTYYVWIVLLERHLFLNMCLCFVVGWQSHTLACNKTLLAKSLEWECYRMVFSLFPVYVISLSFFPTAVMMNFSLKYMLMLIFYMHRRER